MRNFNSWLAQFRESISDYSYYIDFAKVIANAKLCKAALHLLNSLIGSQDVERDFRILYDRYPSVLRALPILLAKREMEIYARDDEGGGLYQFNHPNKTIDEYCVFMRKTGLFDLVSRHLVNNLYDYVVGVEAGLDYNGRKNRGGHQMENLVEGYISAANVEYHKEMYASEISSAWHVNLSSLTNTGKTEKRFDFAVKTRDCVYAVETNFYGGGGSKLNETARSYKMLALESRPIPGFKFVWFTDGKGWFSARQNLQETFDVLPTVFNIKELEDGVAGRLFV